MLCDLLIHMLLVCLHFCQGISLPTTRSVSMDRLSAQAADLIDADDDEVSLDSERFGMMSPEAAAIAGLEVQLPGLTQAEASQHHDGDSDGSSGLLRPSGDSTEDLQRRVATAIASAENAMAMTMASPKSSLAASFSTPASLAPTLPGSPIAILASDIDNGTSTGQPEFSAPDAHEKNEEAQEGQHDDTLAVEVSLASILGDSSPDTVAEEPISLLDMESGSQIAVESVGVSAEDVMALIDNA